MFVRENENDEVFILTIHFYFEVTRIKVKLSFKRQNIAEKFSSYKGVYTVYIF